MREEDSLVADSNYHYTRRISSLRKLLIVLFLLFGVTLVLTIVFSVLYSKELSKKNSQVPTHHKNNRYYKLDSLELRIQRNINENEEHLYLFVIIK